MPREKSRYRDKRSSSYSSQSSHERKKIKGKHKRHPRSTDRSESGSYKRKRSTSKSKYKKRSYSRSLSRDRYESKSRRRSLSRSKSKRSKRSPSRDHSHSRSSSRSRSKYSKSSKKHRRRSHSSSSQSSFESDHPTSRRANLDDIETSVEKAIKAAEFVGLTMTKIPSYDHKAIEVPITHDRNLIAELNSDSFIQTSFKSSRNKKQSQNIVIDLNAETVRVPEPGIKVQSDDSIINFDELPSEEELKEMWIKKLYHYRKKMLKEEI